MSAASARARAARLLDHFAATAVGPVPFLHAHDGGEHEHHVVIGVCVHGDEVGPLPAALRLVEALKQGERRYGGWLSIFVGNPGAVREGRRFLGSDLNRVFIAQPPDDDEGRRADLLRRVLDDADVFLDLHQTGTPTASAFWTLPWTERDEPWVRALRGAPLWMTRPAGQVFSPGTCCADEYVRNRGNVGLTLELSQKGLDAATESAALAVMNRLLDLADDHAAGRRSIQDAAAQEPPVTYVSTAHVEPFVDPRQRLKRGLRNLQPVRAGQRLSPPGAPELRCPIDGLLAFPKYPERDGDGRVVGALPGEIYRVAAPLEQHPRELWGG